MRTFAALFAGCIVGISGMLTIQSMLAEAPASAAEEANRHAMRRLETKSIASIVDNAHLALLVRTIRPELVPDWVDPLFEAHCEELCGESKSNLLACDARAMLEAYYDRSQIAVPPVLHEALEADRRKSGPNWTVRVRLADLNQNEAVLGTRQEKVPGAVAPSD